MSGGIGFKPRNQFMVHRRLRYPFAHNLVAGIALQYVRRLIAVVKGGILF
jgi:hypothetical protein